MDDIKHKDKGGYNYLSNKHPIHLAKEIDVIKNVVQRASTLLAEGKVQRFLVVSDHGASRLAVICEKEEKYDTDTIGKHSGRCCEYFSSHDLDLAVEENGYLALANYGRFKGSRAANVEVHGGASLEEVVIPIIELTINQKNYRVRINDEKIVVDPRHGGSVTLFINPEVENLNMQIGDKLYKAKKVERNLYLIELTDITKAGNYQSSVYSGDNRIANITLKTEGKSGRTNDDFDNLF